MSLIIFCRTKNNKEFMKERSFTSFEEYQNDLSQKMIIKQKRNGLEGATVRRIFEES